MSNTLSWSRDTNVIQNLHDDGEREREIQEIADLLQRDKENASDAVKEARRQVRLRARARTAQLDVHSN